MSSESQIRMRNIVKAFQKYVKTYSDQKFYDTYSEDTFIQDMIYGIGLAINEKEYKFSDGYKKWKTKLVNETLKLDSVEVESGVKS